ncbi:MAG: alpha/beta fold hydrolase [Solirubrobacteraceae bacterium]
MPAAELPESVRAWRDAGGRIELGPHWFFAHEQTGARPGVLLLHGYPSSSYDWREVVARLPDRRLTALDFLGFGLSDKPRRHTYSLAGQADAVEALADRYRGEPVVVAAHDMATSVVTELLARDLEGKLGFRIGAVLLFNGSMVIDKASLTVGQKVLRGPLGPVAASLSNERSFGRALGQLFSAAHPLTETEAECQWALLAHRGGNRLLDRLGFYQHERSTHAARWHGALRDWPGRLELAWAAHDPVCTEAVLQAVIALRPHVPVTRLPELGHYPHIEDPATMARLIDALAVSAA